jgi:hypothetical protein
MSITPQVVFQLGGALGGPVGQSFLMIVAIGVVVLVGRFVLRVAWRLVMLAALVVGLILVATLVLA